MRIAVIAFYLFSSASGVATMDSALANDSSAEIAAGGLVFVKNPNVEMLSEDLYISTNEIRVRYRFVNNSNVDVTTLVAFPLPDITVDPNDSPPTIPTDDPVNLFGFTTLVDGKQVKADVEQKAYLSVRDQTEILRRLNIPLAPHLVATRKALAALSPTDKDRLKTIGLIDDNPYDYPQPLWTLKTNFYWEQRFAAKHETLIEHHYKPSVGSTVPIPVRNLLDVLNGPLYSKYCVDSSFLNDLAKKLDQYSQRRIDYILTTGANWSGPIKEFRLVVDKEKADNIVSFCGENVNKISPTRFEMQKTYFVPDKNIAILILEPTQLLSNEQEDTSSNEMQFSPPTGKFVPGGRPNVSINKFDNSEITQPTNSNNGNSYYFVANTHPPDAYLALRTQPSSSRGQRVATMLNGTLLQVLQRQPDGWWRVRIVATGQEGWALSGQGNRVWIDCCQSSQPSQSISGQSMSDCVGPNESLRGVLYVEYRRHPTGTQMSAYILRLSNPSCILDDEGKKHLNQSEIHVAPRKSGGFSAFVGQEVIIKGSKPPFEQNTVHHFRELVLIDADAVLATR